MAASTALPPGWETGPLAQELKTYLAHKAELLRQSPGKYVLIKDTHIIGLFDHDEEAYNAGYRHYRLAPFLVKQVQEQDKIYYVSGSSLSLPAIEGESDFAKS